ncbi:MULTISPECIES: hypothetical protein [Mycobacteriaceae]|uniref:hypothetical protein n=1 Tax=Mycobacteriaceae TaxID=1762 RepID=UPI0007FD1986|nr:MULTISPECIES: hypothetical protein [Mycobacteriaceae]MCK0174385.1 hypothetical protein [Mycolicibacterium sp. F2034L]OBB60291.1 hypothetical protein A5757_09305 [Mycobacterium sp. 852013-51886_SCH5428379]
MRRTTIARYLSAATVTVAAFGLVGCGDDSPPPAPPPTSAAPISTTPAPPPAAPLPAPEALTDVLYRLADIGVPGAARAELVQDSGPGDAAALDRFGKALADNGFLPLTFEARDIAWSPSQSGDVTANVVVTTPNPQAGEFDFPMDFTPVGSGWQLTRATADLLLDFGAAKEPPR